MFTLLSVSFVGGIMILVIAGLRGLLQNRLHRTVFLLLWLLAALRLAIPGVIPSTASIYNLFAKQEGYVVISYGPTIPVAEHTVTAPEAPSAAVEPVSGETTEVLTEDSSPIPGDVILSCIWAVGCGGCFLYFLWIHLRSRLRYRFALPEEGPAFLEGIPVRRCEDISAPLVYGFFRPVILLPVDFPKKDSPQYDQVLCHEMTHIRSGDLWYKLGMLIVTCIHWFNPMVWLMLYLSTQDLELRCDARVIRKLGQKKIYAMTLVQAEVQQSKHLAEAAFAFSLTELRLKSIAKTRVYLPRSIILCTILSVMLVCCFATGPSAREYEVIQESVTIEEVYEQDASLPAEDLTPSPGQSFSNLGSYVGITRQSLKEERVGVWEHQTRGTASPNRETVTAPVAGNDGSRVIEVIVTGQPVRSSNGERCYVPTGDFTAAFSGGEVWAVSPGEVFDPFQQ